MLSKNKLYRALGYLSSHALGTFAVVELMIGNSVERVIAGDPILAENCMTEDKSQAESIDSVEFLLNGTVTTCGSVKLDIFVTLSLLSGIVMVCTQ